MVLEILRLSGWTPVVNDRLINFESGLLIMSLVWISIGDGILHGPEALFLLSLNR